MEKITAWLNPEAKIAKGIGGSMDAYYDEQLKRWVFPGEEEESAPSAPSAPDHSVSEFDAVAVAAVAPFETGKLQALPWRAAFIQHYVSYGANCDVAVCKYVYRFERIAKVQLGRVIRQFRPIQTVLQALDPWGYAATSWCEFDAR